MTPLILFPSEPFEPKEVDAAFADERELARQSGFDTALVDLLVLDRDEMRAVQHVPNHIDMNPSEPSRLALYRGWMLSPNQYQLLYRGLYCRKIDLINNKGQYTYCHHLPEWYDQVLPHTPESIWFPSYRIPKARHMARWLEEFGDSALILKDYVKSQKHYWKEACFIPCASDTPAVMQVLQRFLNLQGEDLAGGVVFRRYEPLKIIGEHPISGMPLGNEFRMFFLDGEPLCDQEYWVEGVQGQYNSELDGFWPTLKEIAKKIPSRFFTIDIALKADGTWTIIELGDGQVSGLPTKEALTIFYHRLAQRLLSG